MIKARGTTGDGRPLLVLGLSFANLDRLRAGDAIQFDATPYGHAGQIMIFAMRDEATMAAIITGDNPGVKTHIEKDGTDE